MNVCLDDVERTGIFKILLDILLGYLRSSDALLLGSVDDLVYLKYLLSVSNTTKGLAFPI